MDDEADLALLIAAVRAAGAAARERFGRTVRVETKADGSPVSEADIAANDVLRTHLCTARRAYGWLSEENGRCGGAGPKTFVVDPIDGTRAYLRGETAWTVVAAVVEAGRPVAAAIFRPVGDTLYAARRGGGARRNGRAIAASAHHAARGARVALPGPLYREGGFREAGVARAGNIPSMALRLAKVAEGRIDAALTKPGAHHWDLAAADLICHEAGATLTGVEGEPLAYDSESTQHGPVLAGPAPLALALRRTLGRRPSGAPAAGA